MKIVKSLLLVILLCGLLFSQNFEIAHPYRAIDFTSNGFTTNGSKLYISTVYDGHIYEFDFSDPEAGLTDRFRMYPEIKIYPCAGSPIYLPDQDKLYVGSTWGNKIYIFEDVDNNQETEILPEKTWAIDDEKIAYLYRPQRFGNDLYWGAYHSDKSGWAKIVKFDTKSDTASIVSFNQIEKASYTQTLAIAGNFLYAGTENGHILKYNLGLNRVDTHIIDLGVKEKVFYMTTDGSNLYAMLNAGENPLFKIENPGSTDPEIKMIRQKGYKISRIFYHNGILYGANWKYNITSDSIISADFNLGLMGGTTYGGDTYLFGLGKDDRGGVNKMNISRMQIPSEEITNYHPEDLAATEMGAQLQTIAASEYDNKMYMSTYWVGAMYSYNAKNGFEKLKSPQTRHNQADIIKVYNNYVLFGCYGGEGDGYLMRYNTLAHHWSKIELDNDPNKSDYTSRITAICSDPQSKKVFFGSGEQTRNSMTKNAVLRYLPIIRSSKFIDIKYDHQFLGNPVRFVSLVFYNDYLYGVCYNRDMTHYIFKLNISDIENPKFISKRDLGNVNRFKGIQGQNATPG